MCSCNRAESCASWARCTLLATAPRIRYLTPLHVTGSWQFILKYAPFPTSCHITQSVSAMYGCFYFFARNFFILHFLTLQVVFILKTIELPTLWYHYNFIIVKRKKHDLHLKTKIRPNNTNKKVEKDFASAEK